MDGSSVLYALPWFPCLQLWGANGFAQGAIFPAMMTLLAGCLDKRTRGTVLGLWTTSQQLGGVASTAFVGFVLQHMGWRAAYVKWWEGGRGEAVLINSTGFA